MPFEDPCNNRQHRNWPVVMYVLFFTLFENRSSLSFFRSSGYIPLLILRFRMVAWGWDITDAYNFKYFALISSICLP